MRASKFQESPRGPCNISGPGLHSRWPAQGLPRCLPTRPSAGGPGGSPPAQEEECKRPSCLTRKTAPPYPTGGPPLPDRRILLTRQADTPYPTGGYSLLDRRTLLTRQACRVSARCDSVTNGVSSRCYLPALSPRTHWMRRLHQLWPSRWEDLLRARDPVVSS